MVSDHMRQAVKERDRGECVFCGTDSLIEIHHVVPRRMGGEDALFNLVAVCPSCHNTLDHVFSRAIRARMEVDDAA